MLLARRLMQRWRRRGCGCAATVVAAAAKRLPVCFPKRSAALHARPEHSPGLSYASLGKQQAARAGQAAGCGCSKHQDTFTGQDIVHCHPCFMAITDKPGSKVPASLHFTYLTCPGRGEATRILLNYGNFTYKDTRIPLEIEAFRAAQGDMPFGQVPWLMVDGVKLAQQNAIERYLAKLVGLYPEDPLEAAQVDMIATYLYEVMEKHDQYWVQPPEERVAYTQRQWETLTKPRFQKISQLLGDQDFFVANKFTFVDITAFCLTSLYASGYWEGMPTDVIQEWPNLVAHHDRVLAMPPITAMYQDVKDALLLAYAKPMANTQGVTGDADKKEQKEPTAVLAQ